MTDLLLYPASKPKRGQPYFNRNTRKRELKLIVSRLKLYREQLESNYLHRHRTFRSAQFLVLETEHRVELRPLLLDLLVEVAADGLLGPRLVVEVGLAFLLRISGDISHRLQVWNRETAVKFMTRMKRWWAGDWHIHLLTKRLRLSVTDIDTTTHLFYSDSEKVNAWELDKAIKSSKIGLKTNL